MDELIAAARRARASAHAPYSGYPVGAALRDSSGKIFLGCNVENVSYPLSVCAERNAVAEMVLHGGVHIEEIVIASADGAMPCGGCLQVLAEFAADPAAVRVHTVPEAGPLRSFLLAELLPYAFTSERVAERNEDGRESS